MDLIQEAESWPKETVQEDREGILAFLKNPDNVLSDSYWKPTGELAYLVYEKGASLSYQEGIMGNAVLHSAAEAGLETQVRWFLANGAPWNQMNRLYYVPGELALQAGHKKIHDIIFQSAVPQEWKRLYEPCKESPENVEGKPEDNSLIVLDSKSRPDMNKDYLNTRVAYFDPRPYIGPHVDSFAMMDQTGTGVMMEWERPISERMSKLPGVPFAESPVVVKETARLLFDGMGPGKSCLNIGFGMGIIDTYFQSYEPAQHTIIEAHPEALAYMKKTGWYDKPNVRILEGRWQDFIHLGPPSDAISDTKGESHILSVTEGRLGAGDALAHGVGRFDMVYFDTFAEGYKGYMSFWQCVPGLLRGPDSRMSFFHGHCRKNPFMYKVYSEVARWHLNDLGLDTVWYDVTVDPKTVWYSYSHEVATTEGTDVKRESHPFQVPICTLAPTIPGKFLPGCGWASSTRQTNRSKMMPLN